MTLISACLLGVKCRYNGDGILSQKVLKYYRDNDCILLCPEVLGGLDTPRAECEIKENRVINKYGENVTEEFSLGAKKTLEICKKLDIKKVILKENSPSCGVNKIYDGSFSGKKISQMGVTAKLLKENGICVLSEMDI